MTYGNLGYRDVFCNLTSVNASSEHDTISALGSVETGYGGVWMPDVHAGIENQHDRTSSDP
jgi:hypothetical protein